MFIAQYIPSILLLLMSCMSDDAMSPFGWQRGSRYFLSLLSVERLKNIVVDVLLIFMEMVRDWVAVT